MVLIHGVSPNFETHMLKICPMLLKTLSQHGLDQIDGIGLG